MSCAAHSCFQALFFALPLCARAAADSRVIAPAMRRTVVGFLGVLAAVAMVAMHIGEGRWVGAELTECGMNGCYDDDSRIKEAVHPSDLDPFTSSQQVHQAYSQSGEIRGGRREGNVHWRPAKKDRGMHHLEQAGVNVGGEHLEKAIPVRTPSSHPRGPFSQRFSLESFDATPRDAHEAHIPARPVTTSNGAVASCSPARALHDSPDPHPRPCTGTGRNMTGRATGRPARPETSERCARTLGRRRRSSRAWASMSMQAGFREGHTRCEPPLHHQIEILPGNYVNTSVFVLAVLQEWYI